MKMIKYEDTITILKEYGPLKSDEFLPKTKPCHGSCCCCQDCGHTHDECVCEHNECLQTLKSCIIDIDENNP